MQHVAIVTGLSGAGKTTAAKLFEDLGYTVIDNLPSEFVAGLAELVAGGPDRFERVAIVIDVRAGRPADAFDALLAAFESRELQPQVFFLEARDEVLVRRFSETRHRHPLGSGRSIAASIAEERRLLDSVRREADIIVDTSDLSSRELRERIFSALDLEAEPEHLGLQLITFGFKYGLPIEADLVLDVRFIENPYYHADLRPLSGLTEPVRTFVLGQPTAQRFLVIADELFDFLIPAYIAEGKARLTVAIGCTGGYHRSIVIAEEFARRWAERGHGSASVWHRELERA